MISVTPAAFTILLILHLYTTQMSSNSCVHVCIVGSYLFFFHLTAQSPDAQNGISNADKELNYSQGDQQCVHGCQQILMDQK